MSNYQTQPGDIITQLLTSSSNKALKQEPEEQQDYDTVKVDQVTNDVPHFLSPTNVKHEDSTCEYGSEQELQIVSVF